MTTLETLASLRTGTDREVIGTSVQTGDEWFIDAHNTYTWYRAVAQAKAPGRILELGVRYGYAGIAMVKGAIAAGVQYPEYLGVDGELDGISSNDIALKNLYRECWTGAKRAPYSIATYDTQAADIVYRMEKEMEFDLIHVDGDHSPKGILRELYIAKISVARDGWILVDDIDTPHVKNAADSFCETYGIVPVRIPTFHEMYLVDWGQR